MIGRQRCLAFRRRLGADGYRGRKVTALPTMAGTRNSVVMRCPRLFDLLQVETDAQPNDL